MQLRQSKTKDYFGLDFHRACTQKFLGKQLLNNLLITLKINTYCTPNNLGSVQGTQQSWQTATSQKL